MFVFILVGIGFILIGGLFFFIGKFFTKDYRLKNMRCTEEVYGEVAEIIKSHSMSKGGALNSNYSYYPVFKYSTNGEDIKSTYNYGTGGSSNYKIGQEIKLHYNPGNIKEFVIKDDKSPYVLYKVFIILGLLFLVLGFVIILMYFLLLKIYSKIFEIL